MKILYLMHVSWGWIKQRPHFLAELFSKDYDTSIYCVKPIRKINSLNSYHNNGGYKYNVNNFYTPLGSKKIFKIGIFRKLYNSFISLQIPNIKKYDIVWIPSIRIYDLVKDLILPNQTVVYDCMDDELEFPYIKKNTQLKERFAILERQLINRCNKLICSSQFLLETVLHRTKISFQDAIVVNNGILIPTNEVIDGYPDEIDYKINKLRNLKNVFMYVGTISEWFDFDLIRVLLNKNAGVNVVLIGPTEVRIPTIDRLHYIGSVERKYIFEFMGLATALIMPFKVTNLIQSVNPVKLYEYIFMQKPILAPLYGESLQFDKYVYLYNNQLDFINLANKITNGDISAKSERIDNVKFLESSTWESRYNAILGYLNL